MDRAKYGSAGNWLLTKATVLALWLCAGGSLRLQDAFEHLKKDKVHSVIKTDNVPLIKVAERNGMRKEDEFITRYYKGNMLHFLYSVSK